MGFAYPFFILVKFSQRRVIFSGKGFNVKPQNQTHVIKKSHYKGSLCIIIIISSNFLLEL